MAKQWSYISNMKAIFTFVIAVQYRSAKHYSTLKHIAIIYCRLSILKHIIHVNKFSNLSQKQNAAPMLSLQNLSRKGKQYFCFVNLWCDYWIIFAVISIIHKQILCKNPAGIMTQLDDSILKRFITY